MTNSTVQPGMRAAYEFMASPFTPIAVINGTPIYPLQGGRSGGGVRIVAGDADGDDDDDLLDEDDDEDDGDDEEDDRQDELPASMRGKPKPKPKTARRAAPADEDDAGDDAGDDDEDDTPGAIRRMEEALGKANKTAARYRRAGKAVERLGIEDLDTWLTERGIDPVTGRPFGSDVIDPDGEEDALFDDELDEKPARKDPAKADRETVRAIRTAEKRAEARIRAELVPILAQVSATSALREAGFKGDQKKMDKILRLIDPADLDVIVEGGEFEIEGLDDAIAEIRDEFPELFKSDDDDEAPTRRRTTKAAPARRVSGARDVDGDGRGRQAKKAATGGWMDQIVARMEAQGR